MLTITLEQTKEILRKTSAVINEDTMEVTFPYLTNSAHKNKKGYGIFMRISLGAEEEVYTLEFSDEQNETAKLESNKLTLVDINNNEEAFFLLTRWDAEKELV